MRAIKKIIVHCSATREGQDIGIDTIREWHVNDRGWSDIGYHYVIRRNGEIEKGRPDDIAGAHARGVNQTSIGVVWVGETQIDVLQEKAMMSLIHFLMGKYNIKIENVLGHCEAVKTSKTCPNLNMNRVRAELVFIQPIPKVR